MSVMTKAEAVEAIRCQCGEITGVRCEWVGPTSETTEILWVPPYLRGTAMAAGGDTITPYATRLRVEDGTCLPTVSTIYDPEMGETNDPDPWVAVVAD